MAPQSSAAGMISAFYGLHQNERLHQYVSIDKFDEFMGAEGARGVFVYQSPNELIATKLSSGENLEWVLREWCDDVAEKLRIVRRFPRRIIVVENSGAAKGAATKAIEQAFPRCAVPPALFAEKIDASELVIFAAALMVRQDSAAFGLFRELQARSPVAASSLPTLENCLAGLREGIEEFRSMRTGQADMAERLVILEKQKHDAVAMLEQQKHDVAAALEKQKHDAAAVLEKQKKDSVAAQELLTKQIVELQSSLQDCVRQSDETVAGLKRQIEEIYKSTSWRASAPIRAAKRLVAPGAGKG